MERIKKRGDSKFGTCSMFAGQPKRNSFSTFGPVSTLEIKQTTTL